MAAPTLTTRDQWLDAGLRLLADGGPEAVRVEVVARRLGVTKGGFYGQFKDRHTYLIALLDHWEQRVTNAVRTRVEEQGGAPSRRLRQAGLLTFAEDLLPVELAVRDWARRDLAVAARIRRVDNSRMEYLRELISSTVADPVEVEARCLLAYCLALGRHLLAADTDSAHRAKALAKAIDLVDPA